MAVFRAFQRAQPGVDRSAVCGSPQRSPIICLLNSLLQVQICCLARADRFPPALAWLSGSELSALSREMGVQTPASPILKQSPGSDFSHSPEAHDHEREFYQPSVNRNLQTSLHCELRALLPVVARARSYLSV